MKRLLTLGVALVAGMYLTGCAGTARKPSISERSEQTGAAISSYATKTTPVDADKFLISDSEASWSTKNVTFSSLVTTGNSGYALYLSALTDLQILDISTTYTPLVDDTVSYGGTYDAKHVWSIDKVGSELAGKTTEVASGTSALGTSAINTATCATVVTTTATGTATTDVINWGFNGDPTGVTGYAPLATGMLTIIAYPSSGNVNFKVCNNTSASITPGAITLNWQVTR